MNKRAKKVQKRNAKKKAATKQTNQKFEQARFAHQENIRHQSMLTKNILIDLLINDLDEKEEYVKLYFETMENELGIDFDTVKTKPAALEIEMVEEGIKYRTNPWYDRFVSELIETYGEDEKSAKERAWGIATGVMTCMASASEIVTGSPELFNA